MKTKRRTPLALRLKAIRSAWAIARAAGLCEKLPKMGGLMNTDDRVRHAIVRAFECGYRRGKREVKA